MIVFDGQTVALSFYGFCALSMFRSNREANRGIYLWRLGGSDSADHCGKGDCDAGGRRKSARYNRNKYPKGSEGR